ncbi:MAG: type II toxin-antitoxin system VapC family toxin [Rhodospirillaceae bacterium]|nr:type II toxin-antitoxin system VapC family toxin [Rhodospirillaceae bacterium]
MLLVLDSSVAASWCLPDERSELADRALDMVETGGFVVPPLFWYELRNVLIVNERRGRIDAARLADSLRLVTALPARIDSAPDEAVLLGLARAHTLSVYDAAYLELAKRLGIPLATLDLALHRAGAAEAVALVV